MTGWEYRPFISANDGTQIEHPTDPSPGYVMAVRTAHISAWGSGHTHSGPIHDGPCVCECGIIQPYDGPTDEH